MIGCVLVFCGTLIGLVPVNNAFADEGRSGRGLDKEWCRNVKDGSCSPDKRGGCGKRRGDWYGVRRPVTSVKDARAQLTHFFSARQLIVAEVLERPWHFEADVLDTCGKVVDRAMIDKRSGRVRSIY